MSEQNELLSDILTTQRDQAQASVGEFVKTHFDDGDPDDAILSLLGQFVEASHGASDTTALWGILAAYGLLAGIQEYLTALAAKEKL